MSNKNAPFTISSNGRSRFVCGPIDLKFEGEFFNSLISNLNGGDRIWSSGRLLFQSVNSASLLLIFSHPGRLLFAVLLRKAENKTDANGIYFIDGLRLYRRWVDDNVLNHVSEEKHARSLWNKLEQLYAQKTSNNKLFLIKKMMKVQGLWLLGTLSDSWETFRTSLSNSAPDGIMNMDLVKSCVLNEEMRRKSQGSSSQSSVLVIEKRGRSKSRGPKNRDRSKSKTNKFANRDMKQGKVKEKKNDNGGEDDQVATTTSDFLIVYDSDVVNFACQETSWVIDSGASIHATPRKDFFTSYTSGDFGSVRMGNDGSAKAIGMGDVRLETSNGTMLTLKNVKHIPDIRMNLISTGKLDDEGFCNTFRDSQWKLTRGSMVIAKGNKSSSLYLMRARVIDSHGHMSEKGLMILAKKNLLSGMKKGSLKRCAHCLAESARVAFKTLRHTRKPIWVYTLKTKDQVLDTIGEKLKCIRTDNGIFWGEALNLVVHVLNLTPCVPLEFDVPDRIWSNNEVSYDHLRVFGCKAFVHIPKDERSKLDAKTRPCVFIGYDVVFMEDHTIRDIEKTNPMESQDSGDLIDLDPALRQIFLQVEDEAHDDQHDMGDVETPTQVEVDDDVHERSHSRGSIDIPLRRSTETDILPHDEMESLHENHSFELVKLPKGKRALKNRWVYRVKQEEHTSQPRYKARLVVKGFNQKKGIDFDEIFLLLDLEIQQMDVKTHFSMKSLYGLKQAPRRWYKKFESLWGNVSRIDNLKKRLSKSFAMKDLGLVKRILGIRIERDRASKKLCMLQEQYIEKVLARFNMGKAKVVSSPLASHFKLSSRHSPSTDKEKEDMRRVPYASEGSLMYAMVCTRPT
ncbi:hypothetical protein AAG906_025087 [Vitis piasezkii]